MSAPTCNYCHHEAVLVTGKVIYPHRPDLMTKQFWNCAPCKAYVGCHPGTKNPLGRLANAELRRAKQRAHAAFDPLWKSGAMKRKQAYKLLADRMRIAWQNCHIGMMDVEQCLAVVAVIKEVRDGR